MSDDEISMKDIEIAQDKLNPVCPDCGTRKNSMMMLGRTHPDGEPIVDCECGTERWAKENPDIIKKNEETFDRMKTKVGDSVCIVNDGHSSAKISFNDDEIDGDVCFKKGGEEDGD